MLLLLGLIKHPELSKFNDLNLPFLVYVEFGASSTDKITLTNTYTSTGITTAKSYNILARQIASKNCEKFKVYILGDNYKI